MPEYRPIQLVADSINRGLELDRETLEQVLLHSRIPCSEKLVNHPFIQVEDDGEGGFETSVLAIINGLIEPVTGYRISLAVSEDSIHSVGYVAIPDMTDPADEVPEFRNPRHS